MEEVKLDTCNNCGFNTYELIDGNYYCKECNQLLENEVKQEIDHWQHNETMQFRQDRGSKIKDSKKKEEKKLRGSVNNL